MRLGIGAFALVGFLLSVACWLGCGTKEPPKVAAMPGTPAREGLAVSPMSPATAPAREMEEYSRLRAPDAAAPLSPSPTPAPLDGLPSITHKLPAADAKAGDHDAPGDIQAGEGIGPGQGGDKFDPIVENPFQGVKASPLSTFSIDVDTASYSKMRMYLMQQNALPPASSVRIEEFVNYFDYGYAPPTGEHPFAVHVAGTVCPWNPEHRLVRIGIKGKVHDGPRPVSNIVFLLDVSGSMNEPNKLPLLKHGIHMLLDQLGENDIVSIVVYAGAAGEILPPTTADKKSVIREALDRLQAGGSTNGGAGIRLAYNLARANFIKGGVNRVILCTDGDFNVGTTSTGELVTLAEEQAKANVYLTVLGFGMGNHNDAMLEQLSNKANGNYAFIDTEHEARKVLVDQLHGTLMTIAKDVKIQVEFNPMLVESYRLIGYENRVLADRDFNDDKKDAGDIGAGHMVTALYEIVPAKMVKVGGQLAEADKEKAPPEVDSLKYQQERDLSKAAASGELLTVKLRYKQPEGDKSTLMTTSLTKIDERIGDAGPDFQFAAAVALFGMVLRDSPNKGTGNCDTVLELAEAGLRQDAHGYRAEFVQLVKGAKALGKK